jgi:uncharacterized protein YutE (UPF0331/DUF86 family)
LLSRIENLEENIYNLKKLKKKINADDIANNKFDEWALRYGIFESIQIVIDISCHLASKYNLGTSKTYVECIENLHNFDYISKDLTKDLISAIGLRNMLIHEYIKIDTEKLYSYLNLVDDFESFIKAVKEFV